MTRLCSYSHSPAVSQFTDADQVLTDHLMWELQEMVRLLKKELVDTQAREARAIQERDEALAAGLKLQLDLAGVTADAEQLADRLAEADAMRDMAAVGLFNDLLVDVDEFAAVTR